MIAEMEAGFRMCSWGGAETGGLLLGKRKPDSIEVLGYREIPCEHEYGPSWELTAKESEAFGKVVAGIGEEVVGWYRSVTRQEAALSTPDQAIFDEVFSQDGMLALVIKRAKQEPCKGTLYARQLGKLVHAQVGFDDSSASPELASSTVLKPELASPSTPHIERLAARILSLATPTNSAPVPSAHFFHETEGHRRALASLENGIAHGKGFLLLEGESGLGKSMLLNRLMDRLNSAGIEIGFVKNSRINAPEFFELLAMELGLDVSRFTKPAVLIALRERLNASAVEGKRTVLMFDDAHNLSTAMLSEIELLGNLEARPGRVLQIVMAARPEIENTLRLPELRGLRQRFLVRAHLQPMTGEETAAYICHRLRYGSMRPEAIPEDLHSAIHCYARGIPRLVSALSGMALERTGGGRPATLEAVHNAVTELGLQSRSAQV